VALNRRVNTALAAQLGAAIRMKSLIKRYFSETTE
jgi:hypothetical protein